ncbi:hypothetical protein ACJ72_00552 [Emergomyces africanus]|uniref:Uncharacterized protein n=1 Tax=Emergomyces africanus TaxID=1955775 RepID=A0A1B7P7R7_9EURO|nr:hypothetical protein ACJ72_00552 [Emergomyces africanus]
MKPVLTLLLFSGSALGAAYPNAPADPALLPRGSWLKKPDPEPPSNITTVPPPIHYHLRPSANNENFHCVPDVMPDAMPNTIPRRRAHHHAHRRAHHHAHRLCQILDLMDLLDLLDPLHLPDPLHLLDLPDPLRLLHLLDLLDLPHLADPYFLHRRPRGPIQKFSTDQLIISRGAVLQL